MFLKICCIKRGWVLIGLRITWFIHPANFNWVPAPCQAWQSQRIEGELKHASCWWWSSDTGEGRGHVHRLLQHRTRWGEMDLWHNLGFIKDWNLTQPLGQRGCFHRKSSFPYHSREEKACF